MSESKWSLRVLSDEEMAAEQAENARLYAEMVAAQCACKLTGSMPYLLEIEENRVVDLKCAGCGKSVPSEWIEDALSTTADIPVTVTWVKEADDYWTGEYGAFYGEISPREADPADNAPAPHDPADCGTCDDHADATTQADRDERNGGGQ